MKWLHISDLHIDPGDGRSTKQLRKKLIRYIKDHNITADYLFLTGDYRNAKYSHEKPELLAKTGADFIIDIANAAQINISNIHLVPGNHDLDRTHDTGRIERIRENYNRLDGKFEKDDLRFLLERFTFFNCLCNELQKRGVPILWSETLQPLHPYICLEDFSLLCINTCIICNSDQDRHNLIIGNDALYQSLEEIRAENPGKPILMLAHHGLSYLHDDERPVVENLLREYPVKLYLCGDTHKPWVRWENHHIEITMGCSVEEGGSEAVFSIGRMENDIPSVEAYEWKASVSSWQPFTAFNEYFAGNKPRMITKIHPLFSGRHSIGRDNKLAEIKRAIDDNKILLLYGMGGIGKTEICRLLFEQYQTTDNTVKQLGWVFYQNNVKDTFWKQFPEIEAKKDVHGEYSIFPNPEYGELADAEAYWSAAIKYINKPEQDILLVIDNANDITNSDLMLLEQLNCKMILTSRKAMDRVKCIEVDRLDPESCRIIYRTYSHDYAASDEIIQNIISLADGHTLLIELLAKLQRAAGLGAEQLYRRLKEEHFDLSNLSENISYLHNPEIHPDELWDKQITEHIEKLFNISEISQSPEKMQILRFFSLISPGYIITMQTVKKWMDLPNMNMVNALVDGGWLNRSDQNGIPALTMHPLVYIGICHMVVPDETQETIWVKNAAADILIKGNETALDKTDILPVAEALWNNAHIRNMEYLELFGYISAVYLFNGEYKTALEYFKKLLEMELDILDEEHPYIAKTYNSIGMAYDGLVEYESALEWFKKGAAMHEATLGSSHLDTAVSYSNIASVYFKLYNLSESRIWIKKAMDILDSYPNSEDSQEKATIYTAKGNVCLLEERVGDSIDWFKKALEIQKKISGEDHPTPMTVYNNIGLIYHACGKCEDALAIYQQVREASEKKWGEKHPNTTSAYRNIGNVYRAKRRYRDALKWYEKTAKIREEVYGVDHIRTGNIYNDIGLTYTDCFRYAKALKYFDKALAIYEAVLGKEDEDTKKVRNNKKEAYWYLELFLAALFLSVLILIEYIGGLIS